MRKQYFAGAALALCVPFVAAAQEEKVDLSVVNRIKAEAFDNSRVMEHLFYLTDVYGPRIADSPNYLQAAGWAVKQLQEWGLKDARLEKWGKFGRSWTWTRFAANMIEPQQTSLTGVPLAWSPGTPGAVTGEVVLAPMRTVEDGAKYKGTLKGRIVLIGEPRELKPHFEADARRWSDADLAARALAPEPGERPHYESPPLPPGEKPPTREQLHQAHNKLNQFLEDEGVLAVVTPGYGGDDGTIFAAAAGSREAADPIPPVSIALASEHYNRLARLVDKKIPVKLELDVRARILEDHPDGVNVIASLPGGARKDEIVMLGAHLDSWQAATGATDNAAGCAVALEAVRILAALNLKMERTVRVALWDAEEEGLVGSREYVKEHFADRETMRLKPEYAKLSGYFNLDNGSGKIRGVNLQGNDMMRPIFEAWLAPFRDLGATTITIRNTGGTDHLSFDAVGLPGFQFIQDPLDYMSRTHHSNMDVYDRVQNSDLMQAAAIMASFVYDAATRPEMLPRRPMPKPEAKKEARQ
jgi:carboxypeptidase Q